MKFIHITDLHLVKPHTLLHGLDPADRFARCIDDINRFHDDAECCVITGDLADAGESLAYQWLQDELKRCKVPCHILIGNHDHRERIEACFGDHVIDHCGFAQSVVETSAGVFLLLDTVKAGTHSGVYCEKRRQWLREQLERYQDRDLFLFMHHPPFDIHLPCLDTIGLQEQNEFADVVKPFREKVRHLFFGHAHRPLAGNWLGISYSSIRGTNHQVTLNFSSEEIIYVDEPPEYSIVFVDEDRIVVHTHSYPLQP